MMKKFMLGISNTVTIHSGLDVFVFFFGVMSLRGHWSLNGHTKCISKGCLDTGVGSAIGALQWSSI